MTESGEGGAEGAPPYLHGWSLARWVPRVEGVLEGCGLEKVGERSDRPPTLPNPNTEIMDKHSNYRLEKKMHREKGWWVDFS